MSCYPAAQEFARACAAQRTATDNPCHASPDTEELEGTTTVCANQEHQRASIDHPRHESPNAEEREANVGQKHKTNTYLQPLPPLSRREEERDTITAAEACSYSATRDVTRARGAQQASIYSPCHKSPDAEALETAAATRQPLPRQPVWVRHALTYVTWERTISPPCRSGSSRNRRRTVSTEASAGPSPNLRLATWTLRCRSRRNCL